MKIIEKKVVLVAKHNSKFNRSRPFYCPGNIFWVIKKPLLESSSLEKNYSLRIITENNFYRTFDL